jgi:hypothetical protein
MAAPPQPAAKPEAADPPKPSQPIAPKPIVQGVSPEVDPLRPRPDMKAAEVENASPNHLLVPDPLPPLNRSIFESPHVVSLHMTKLHDGQVAPHVEAAVEELRMRLGEMREFLKRFPHDVGGDLGHLVDHLRSALGVARPDPVRDATRQAEDQNIMARRRMEDDLGGPPEPHVVQRRIEEDAGIATLRRVQDTAP